MLADADCHLETFDSDPPCTQEEGIFDASSIYDLSTESEFFQMNVSMHHRFCVNRSA